MQEIFYASIVQWIPLPLEELLVSLVSFSTFLKAHMFFIYLGALFSGIVYFRKEILDVIVKDYKFRTNSIFWFLLISVLTAGGVSLLLRFLFDTSKTNLTIVSVFFAILLIFYGIYGLLFSTITLKTKIHILDSFLAGVLIGVSFVRGICALQVSFSSFILRYYEPELALEMSYLILIPVFFVKAVVLFLFSDVVLNEFSFFAFLISYTIGYFTIKYSLYALKKTNYEYLCIIYGLLTMVVVFF